MILRLEILRLIAVPGLLFAAVFCGACGGVEPPLPPELQDLRARLPVRPDMNVIIISFDAMRADVLGVYGHEGGTSPNIDAFAERSLVFDNAYTVAPVTPTSFAAAFTGMLPTRVFHAWKFVAEDTIAQRFSDAGYTSAGLFNSVQLTPERSFDRGFDEYVWRRNDPDDEFLDLVSLWLMDHADEKLFGWIHFLVPHAPYVFRDMAASFYDPGYQGPFEKTTGGTFTAERAEDIARIRSLYEGQVYFTDSLFGKLIARMEKLGLLESSVVVLTADHGEEFYERGGFQHGKLYEEHVRIPLLIFHPDVQAPARTSVLTSNVDLMPTLLSLVGQPVEVPMDGRDLISILSSPELLLGVSMTGGEERSLSLRRGSQKLILDCLPERAVALYDLAADPGETTDLASAENQAYRPLASELAQILGGEPCEVMRGAVRGELQTTGLDEESVKALRALGYLD